MSGQAPFELTPHRKHHQLDGVEVMPAAARALAGYVSPHRDAAPMQPICPIF